MPNERMQLLCKRDGVQQQQQQQQHEQPPPPRSMFVWHLYIWLLIMITWQAQFDQKVLALPHLKCFTGVKNHRLVTDKAALVQQGLRLMGT